MGTASLTATALALTRRDTGSLRPILAQVLRWRVSARWYMGLGVVLLTLSLHLAIGGLEEPHRPASREHQGMVLPIHAWTAAT